MIIRNTLWTSDLYIQTDLPSSYMEVIWKEIVKISQYIERNFSKFHNGLYSGKVLNELEWRAIEDVFRPYLKGCKDGLIPFVTYKSDGTTDFTGLLKGLFLDELVESLKSMGSEKYLINFGGDITSKGYNIHVDADYDDIVKFAIESSEEVKIFTSGNGKKRGNHIEGGVENEFVTLVSYGNKLTCTDMDIISTSFIGSERMFNWITAAINKDYYVFHVIDGKLTTGMVYVASPFFEPKEIEIRDKMIAHLYGLFRPDETDDNKNYDAKGGETHTEEVAMKIMENNVHWLNKCSSLVFPEGTDDIGTLFEVGLAMKLKKPIIRYNPKNDSYTLTDSSVYGSLIVDNYSIIDCRTVTGAVVLGFNYPDPTLGYYLGKNIKDNLMISVNFHKMDLDVDKFVEVEKNYEEVR